MADKILKVKWLVADKRLIKFVDVEDSYNIADGVDITGIENGKTFVTMEIKDNIVVKLDKQDVKEEKAPEDKPVEEKTEEVNSEKPAETEPQDCPEEKLEEAEFQPLQWTISAIAFDKGVVKFSEQNTEKYWYPILAGAKGAFKGLKKGDIINIIIGKVDAESQAGEKYQKDGVVSATAIVKEEAPKEDKPVEEKEPEKSGKAVYKKVLDPTRDSIERQVAVKEAGAIICSLIEQGGEMVNNEEKINNLLSSFTKGSLDALHNA